jgi:hypothetical protein
MGRFTLKASQASKDWLVTEDTEFHRRHRRGQGPRRTGPPEAAASRPKKRGSGAPGMQPMLSERTLIPFSVVSSFLPCLP